MSKTSKVKVFTNEYIKPDLTSGSYTIKKMRDGEYLCKVSYKKEKGKLKQKWEYIGSVKNIGVDHVEYPNLIKAQAVLVGKEAKDIYEQYKRGMVRQRAESELLKLLER